MKLARAEMSDKASRVMFGANLLAGAALFAMPALVLLLMALAAWLGERGWMPATSNLIAGIVGLVIAALLGAVGLGQLKAQSLAPERTLGQQTFAQFMDEIVDAPEREKVERVEKAIREKAEKQQKPPKEPKPPREKRSWLGRDRTEGDPQTTGADPARRTDDEPAS